MLLQELAKLEGGTPQFRIKEIRDKEAPAYYIYTQIDLKEDLVDTYDEKITNKIIRTYDDVDITKEDDIIFSLVSGETTIVRKNHEGYIFTHNYIRITPSEDIDVKFLVYYLNENKSVKRQFAAGLQGSTVIKYTLKQLKSLEIQDLPTLEKQKLIGEIYFKRLKIQNLKETNEKRKTELILRKLEEVSTYE